MVGRLPAWRARRAALAPEPAPAAATTPGPPARPEARPHERRTGALHRTGNGWLVALDDRRAFVADRVGLRYLAQLLRNPGQGITALALAAGAGPGTGDGPAPGLDQRSSHALLDAEARAAYAARIRDLQAELDEAEAHADLARASRRRAELDALVDQLAAATGLHGRPRAFPHQAERARTAVRKALKRAVDEIDGADPVIGRLLRGSITTGTLCVYAPDPVAPVDWSVTPAGGPGPGPGGGGPGAGATSPSPAAGPGARRSATG
jgi:hypothetical protein